MRILLAIAFALFGLPAIGQPFSGSGADTGDNNSLTIAATNVFQQVFPAVPSKPFAGRKSCTIQNNGTSTMYVYFGAIGTATLDKSAQLSPGSLANCRDGDMVITTQVSITGTAGDPFYAMSWK